jgi:hypothetical protein
MTDKKIAPLCRQCDYVLLTQFLHENEKLLSENAHASMSDLDRGAAYARKKISDFAASPSIVTSQWDKFSWTCHCCKLLQVRKVILELEAEIKAEEEESILFYWGVAMIVATAKNVAGTVTRACR